jgi:hypothetical protein
LVTARKKELYILPSQRLFIKLNEFIDWNEDKNMKQDTRYKSIVRLMTVINGGDLAEYLNKEKKRIAIEAKKAEVLRVKKLNLEITKFEDYEISRMYGTDQDYVRLSRDGENVETSQNVSVSRKEAKILYKLIEAKKDIKGLKISNYTVISLNGTLTIGCHHINIDSMHKIGKQL